MKTQPIKKFGYIILALLLAYSVWQEQRDNIAPSSSQSNTQSAVAGDQLLAQAFRNQQSDVQVQGQGVVSKLLPDDLKGSRHQRFIVKLASGQSLLVAHNIDLAPKITQLREGDTIEFYGEYEWNNKGGVLHWTHHDPRNKHVGGWLKHQGKIYQ